MSITLIYGSYAHLIHVNHIYRIFPTAKVFEFLKSQPQWLRWIGYVSRVAWWRHQMETFSALLALCGGIHRSYVVSPHKGQWRGALMFSLICTWTIGWKKIGQWSETPSRSLWRYNDCLSCCEVIAHHLRSPDMQMSCNDLTMMREYRYNSPSNGH